MPTKYARDQPQGFTNRIERVAIVGAGGQVGKPITEALLATGKHTVTALTRGANNSSSSSSPSSLPPGIHHVHQVDYSQPSTLVQALQNQQVLIITMAVSALYGRRRPSSSSSSPSDDDPTSSSSSIPQTPLEALITAAAQAGVGYVLPNWYGQDPLDQSFNEDVRFLSLRDEPRQLMKKLGGVSKPIMLACSFWYEFSLGGGIDRFGFDLINRTVRWFDHDDDDDGGVQTAVKMPCSTWSQCGRAIAGLLSLPEFPENEEEEEGETTTTLSGLLEEEGGEGTGAVYIQSFELTQREMYESVKRVTGTQDEDWTDLGSVSSKKVWEEAGKKLDEGDMGSFVKLLYSRGWWPREEDGNERMESVHHGRHNEILGLPKEDLDEATRGAVRFAGRGGGAAAGGGGSH